MVKKHLPKQLWISCMALCFSSTLMAQVIDTTAVKIIEKPGFIASDLNNSLPKKESVLEGIMPSDYTDYKEKFYQESKYHIQYNISYQNVVMASSSVVRFPDVAAGGAFLFELESTLLNFKEDFQGSIAFSISNTHLYGSAAATPLFNFNTGSLLAHEGYYLGADWVVSDLYWEQYLKKDRFFVRLGQHIAISMIDFSRYADFRTSITNPAVGGVPAGHIPFGPPALGLSFKLLPKEGSVSGFYLVGHISDINSEINRLDWGNIFETGDFFSAVELGYNWGRLGDSGPELDHLHLLLFYGTEASKKQFFSKAGFGCKLAGEKQFGRWVAIANYAYNDAVGGGFGFTNFRHAFNGGIAYTKPLGIKGEAMFTYTWGQVADRDGGCGPLLRCDGSSQSMMEAYWKILLLPEVWITPGMQFVIDPKNNPDANFAWVPLLKCRMFF